jgi:lysophospholipase L1-like esterase
MKSTIKKISLSLLPAMLLLGLAEIGVRVLSLDKPSFVAGGSGLWPGSIVQADVELGWSLKPYSKANTPECEITTNSLGLRSPEIGPKQKNEFRILSLGESSTFGIDVGDSETYSAFLQKFLNISIPSRPITVINAGVSAYSSFQSLKYLKLHGLKLKPDLILFYHEVNDYLPSAVHDMKLNEIGILKTDKQLYDSLFYRISRLLEQKSGLYRALAYHYAKYKIKKLNRQDFRNPTLDIGLPDLRIGLQFWMCNGQKKISCPQINPLSLGRRVSEEERWEIFRELYFLCKDHHLHLIIIHPSYKYTTPHECILTRFCRQYNVLMFEAHNSLHPEGIPIDVMFLDLWHPTAYGHECLAKDLSQFITDHILKE